MPSFTYTLIPADSDEPYRELSLPIPEALEENIGCLTKACNEHYTKHAPVMGEAGKQAIMESVKAQIKKQQPDAADPNESMLGMLSTSQTCDIVQLLPSTPATEYLGVNMYVDDKGVAKGAPLNARAGAICAACGLPTEVRGDAFVARLRDDQNDIFERLDLRVADISSDAGWMKTAAERNANRADLPSAAQQLSAAGGAGAPAEPAEPLAERLRQATDAKAEGTDHFKKGGFGEAAELYMKAARLLKERGGGAGDGATVEDEDELRSAREMRVVCLCNLAMCRLRQDRPYDAIDACDTAIELDAGAGKAWYRRGQACMAMGQYAAARKNLARAATLLPSSREIRDAHALCQEQLAAEKEKPVI